MAEVLVTHDSNIPDLIAQESPLMSHSQKETTLLKGRLLLAAW